MERFTEHILEDGTTRRIPLGVAEKPEYVKEQEEGIYALKFMQWDSNEKRWSEEKRADTKASETLESLRFVTYNVWFSERNQVVRS